MFSPQFLVALGLTKLLRSLQCNKHWVTLPCSSTGGEALMVTLVLQGVTSPKPPLKLGQRPASAAVWELL